MRLGKVSLRPWQVAVIVAAFVAHIVLFFSVYNRWTAGVGYFVLIPLIAVAAILGLRGGLLLATEVVAWAGYIHYHNKGLDGRDAYESFADEHWSYDGWIHDHPATESLSRAC